MGYINPHYHRDYFRAQGDKRRAYLRTRYHADPRKQAAAERRYRTSPKGQATRARYNHSPKAIAARARWRQEHPDRCTASAFRWRLKKRGVTLEWFQRQLGLQDFRCSICRVPFPTDGLRVIQVDHDHHTGHARGLLCQLCNNGLGCFHDTAALCRTAAAYLDQYPRYA